MEPTHEYEVDHDRGEIHGDVPADQPPRRLTGWDYQGTHTILMDDCVASSIFEHNTFIAQSVDGTIIFIPMRNWTLIQLDAIGVGPDDPSSNQLRLFDAAGFNNKPGQP